MRALAPLLLSAAALAAPAAAQDTPEAWISRMAAVAEKPVETKQSMKFFIRGTEVTMNSDLLFLDDKHFAIVADIETYWPEQEQRVRTRRRTIGDGKKQWNEMTNLETGQGRHQEMSFEQVAALSKKDLYQGKVHPLQQLLVMLDYTDPEEIAAAGDLLTLTATISEEGKGKLVPMLGGVVPKELIIEIDRKTAFPRSWQIRRFTGETVLRMDFAEVRFPEPEKIDRARFVFRPAGEIIEPPAEGGAADGDQPRDQGQE